jgi:hypothetical protein
LSDLRIPTAVPSFCGSGAPPACLPAVQGRSIRLLPRLRGTSSYETLIAVYARTIARPLRSSCGGRRDFVGYSRPPSVKTSTGAWLLPVSEAEYCMRIGQSARQAGRSPFKTRRCQLFHRAAAAILSGTPDASTISAHCRLLATLLVGVPLRCPGDVLMIMVRPSPPQTLPSAGDIPI